MRARRKQLALLATTVFVAIAAAGAVATAHDNDDSEDNSREIRKLIDSDKPKNVILLIGDGMGDSEITLARYYGKGAAGTLNMEKLPFAGELITYGLSAGPGPNYPPNYVPDSAPTATAWSTGKKTIDGRLSQGPSAAENIPGSNAGYRTTFEIAAKRGMRVGNVSTAEITDATPAAPSSHMSQRACQGPEDTRKTCPSEAKGAGGLGSIAEQQVDHLLDVNLGGGRNRFLQTLDGGTGTVVDYAKTKGYRYVETAGDLEGISSLDKGPVLGLFNTGNMTTEFKPLLAALTPGAGGPTTRCDETNRPANEPSLEAMTRKAIQLLGEPPRLLPPGRGGLDRQARPRLRRLRPDRREPRLRQGRRGGARLPAEEPGHAGGDHRRPLAHEPDRRGHPGPAGLLRDAADGRRRADPRLLRDRQDAAGGQSHTGARVPVAAIGPQATNVMGVRDQTDLFQTLIGRDD